MLDTIYLDAKIGRRGYSTACVYRGDNGVDVNMGQSHCTTSADNLKLASISISYPDIQIIGCGDFYDKVKAVMDEYNATEDLGFDVRRKKAEKKFKAMFYKYLGKRIGEVPGILPTIISTVKEDGVQEGRQEIRDGFADLMRRH
jgi:hypothetical protein